MPTCPADDCDYSGVVKSVCAHYSGKQDDAHTGGYHDAKAKLDDVIDRDGGSQNDPEPDGGSNDELDFPENPDNDTDPDPEPSRSRCPECGSGNYASSSMTLEKVPNLSDGSKRSLKAHDYHCHDCGEVFDL